MKCHLKKGKQLVMHLRSFERPLTAFGSFKNILKIEIDLKCVGGLENVT